MAKKAITKRYLKDRCTFTNQTVIKAVNFDGLWAIIKALEVEDQYAVFKIVDKELHPLNEDQIDALTAYLPNEIRAPLDFISMSKKEKLDVVRENKEILGSIIEKKGFTETIDLNSKKVIPREEYSAANLWDIIKSGRYDLS